MAEDDLIPAQQPAFLGEWSFINTITAPPSTGQLRLNATTQPSATKIWVHRVTANGNESTDILSAITPGQTLRLQDKGTTANTQTYLVNGAPTPSTNYFEYPVVWQSGGSALTQGRVLFDALGASVTVNVTGIAAAVSAGLASVDLATHIDVVVPVIGVTAQVSANDVFVPQRLDVVVPVTSPLVMRAEAGRATVSSYMQIPGMAFPSDTPLGFSPGMTLRQYYVGQALMGFLASGAPVANLIGKGAQYCFQVADSMIAYEKREAAGEPPRIVGQPKQPTSIKKVA